MSKSSTAKIDINVETLIIEEDRPEHIAKHGVVVKEVSEELVENLSFLSL